MGAYKLTQQLPPPPQGFSAAKLPPPPQGFSVSQQAEQPQPVVNTAPQETPSYIQNIGAVEAARIGAGSSFAKVMSKAKQVGLEALSAPERAFLENEGFKKEQLLMEPLREARPISTGVGEFVGETAALAPIGGPAFSTGRKLFGMGGAVAGRAGGAALAGAAESGVMGAEGEEVAQAAAISTAAEFLLPVIGSAAIKPFKKYFGKNANEILETGSLSPETRAQIVKSGEIPEELMVKSISEMDKDLSIKKDIITQLGKERAESFGFTLDEAQALQDYSLQDLKQTVLKYSGSEGDIARALDLQQQVNIEQGIQDRVLNRFNSSVELDFTNKSDDFTKVQLGNIVKDSIEELKTRDEKLVSAAYKAARESAAPDIKIKPDGALGQRMVNSYMDHIDLFAIDDKDAQKSYEAFAKFGFFGKPVKKEGIYSYIENPIDPSKQIRIQGDIEPLSIKNAEEFRKRWVALQKTDETGLGYVMKNEVDKVTNDVIDAFPDGSDSIEGFRNARGLFRDLKSTFESGDIIQDLNSFKRGSDVAKIAPEVFLDRVVLRSSTKIDNLKRLKNTLLNNNPTPASKAAWVDVQAVTLEEMLKRSVGKNGLNGQTLNRQLNSFGDTALAELYGEKGKNQIKAMAAAISDATIPIEGTVNYSNTQAKALNFLGSMARKLTAGGSDVVGGAYASSQSLKELQKGLSVISRKRFPQNMKIKQSAQNVANWINSMTAASIGTQSTEAE